MKDKLYIHSHIHNNTFDPDSAVVVKIMDETWKEDYDFETLATRHLGNDLHIIISIPHIIYGFQRYDLVKVDDSTDEILKLEHRGRNTSARFIFEANLIDEDKRKIIDDLIAKEYSIDPYNFSMIGVDLDIENSREVVKKDMNHLLELKKIRNWEYVIQN